MNFIYTVSPTTHEVVYYAGYSYVETNRSHVCNCEYCPNSPSKRIKYNFTIDRSKALMIAHDDEIRGIFSVLNEGNGFGVPLWIRGQKFRCWYVTPMQPNPPIMTEPEYYRL